MRRERLALAILCIGIATLGTGIASGQGVPGKAVRFITAEPGGGNDFAARLIAQGLTSQIGQPAIVENRGGANGIIAGETVAKSQPDGYTLLLYSSITWILPFMQSVPYDPVRDFAPITLAAIAPNILVIHPSLPAKTVRELITLAKAKPGQLSYGTGGSGSTGHLSAELFRIMANIDMVRIPYKGTAPGLTALIGGDIQLMFPAAGAVASYVKSGKLRALGITSAKPSALAPGVPTIAAAGLQGFDSVSTYGIFAPSKTPATMVTKLNQEIVRVLNFPEVKEQFFKAGMETVGNTSDEFAAAIKSEMTTMGKVIKDAGIRSN